MSVPKYTQCKDSGIEWLGKVPTHWTIRRLGFHFRERREKVSDKDFEPLSVTMQGIVPRIDTAAKSDDGDNRKKVCVGDFVINSRSDRKGSAGVSTLSGSVSLISTVLEPKESVVGSFIHHLLRSVDFQEEYYRHGKGIVADLWSTNFSEMRNIALAMPPIAEQSLIATFLNRETSKIDTLVAEQERLIELLTEKRQAVISHAVIKGLNPDVPMKPSGIEWLGTIPRHWDAVRLRRVVIVDQGCAFSHDIQGQDAGDLPWFKVNDMNRRGNEIEMNSAENYVDEELADAIRVNIFPAGTVIFPRVGAALLTNKRRILTSRSIVDDNIYACIPTDIVPEYLYLVLLQIDMASLCSAGLVPTVTFSAIRELYVPLPSEDEQRQIAAFCASRTKEMNLLIIEAENAIALLQERRTALISAAVTGKIDIRGLVETGAA